MSSPFFWKTRCENNGFFVFIYYEMGEPIVGYRSVTARRPTASKYPEARPDMNKVALGSREGWQRHPFVKHEQKIKRTARRRE